MDSTRIINIGGGSGNNISADDDHMGIDGDYRVAYDKLRSELNNGQISSSEFQRLSQELSIKMTGEAFLENDRLEKNEKNSLKRAREFIFRPTEEISVQKAQQSLRTVLNNSSLNLNTVEQAPIESMMLMAANLGIKTFGNSANAMAKNIKSNTAAQEKILNKKLEEYQQQVDKQIEEAKQAKKQAAWAKFLKPFSFIMKALKPVMDLFKPILNLVNKIPFMKEIKVAMAVVAAVVCPATLPLALAALAGTATAATFSFIADKMGSKAPDWLKLAGSIGSNVIDFAASFGVGSFAVKLLAKSGPLLNSAFSDVKSLINKGMSAIGDNALSACKSTIKWTGYIQGIGSSVDSITQGAIGIERSKLQKVVAEIDALLAGDEAGIDKLKMERERTTSRMENVVSQQATALESATSSLTDMTKLRARIANSLA